MRPLEGGRGELCYSCGRLVAIDGGELGVVKSLGERVEIVQAAAIGAAADLSDAVIGTARDVERAFQKPMERAIDRFFGDQGNDR